jgi:hypothetical protein
MRLDAKEHARSRLERTRARALAAGLAAILVAAGPIPSFAGDAPADPDDGGPHLGRWIVLEMFPDVSEETLDLLSQVTMERSIEAPAGATVEGLLARAYGVWNERVEYRFRLANGLGAGATEIAEGVRVHLPPGPYNSPRDVVTETTLWRAIKDEVPQASDAVIASVVRDVRNEHPGLLRRERSIRAGTELRVPSLPHLVAFRLRPRSEDLAEEIAALLRRDDRVVRAYVDGAYEVSASLELEEECRSLASACAITDSLPWPYRSLLGPSTPYSELVGNGARVRVAIIDSGIPVQSDARRPDSRFRCWSNSRERMASAYANGEDDDGNGYPDDAYGLNAVERRGFPVEDLTREAQYNHGTHVAGIATGRLLPDDLVRAVDKAGVEVMVLKVLGNPDASGSAYAGPDSLRSAIDYAVRYNANIINLSLEGTREFSKSLYEVIRDNPQRLFVIAAGNHRVALDSNPRYPVGFAASMSNVIAVAASDCAGRMWRRDASVGSSYGRATVSLAAPGVCVESTVGEHSRRALSGTSQAAPLVSFAAALLWTKGVEDPTAIKARLMGTVDRSEEMEVYVQSGGILNINRALAVYDDIVVAKDGTPYQGRIVSPEGIGLATNKIQPWAGVAWAARVPKRVRGQIVMSEVPSVPVEEMRVALFKSRPPSTELALSSEDLLSDPVVLERADGTTVTLAAENVAAIIPRSTERPEPTPDPDQ